jgi:tetratricopeptide (TPR) repeat protein
LAAEARMDEHPWRLWRADGSPAPGTEGIVESLQAVLKKHPDHPGANHFFIHSVEASPHPELGLAAAKRLPTLMPGAGHIVHMPAHIYMRTGQYARAVAANEQAIAVDKAYLHGPHVQGTYSMMYVAHNFHFLWAAAAMEGNAKKAIWAAEQLSARFPPEILAKMARAMPGMDFFVAPTVMARIRFGRWDELLALEDPGSDEPYLRAMWHYGRGIAFAAKGQQAKARAEQSAFDGFFAKIPEDAQLGPLNSARAVMTVAQASLAGELALRTDSAETAIPFFEKAVKAEDALGYDEPPPWFLSPRQELGFALLKVGRAKDAETVYRKDLSIYRENGWSLFGLREALKAQKKPSASVNRRFRKAWAQADTKLTGSIL